MRKVDLDFIKNNNQYIWEKAVGQNIKFVYDNVYGELYISEIYWKGRMPYYVVKYDNDYYHIRVYELQRADIYKIIKNSIECHNWAYNIGDNLKDEKRDLIITNKKYGDYISTMNNKNGQKIGKLKKQYQYKCNICGFDATGTDYWVRERDLKVGFGCTCCRGFTVVKGINDFGSKHPDLIKYFFNEDDAYTHSEFSSDYIKTKCPVCGFVKEMKLADLSMHNYFCPKCSDGISYPEKFLMSVLDQLNVPYIYQLSSKDFEWIHNFLYDFYIKDKNVIIELHGLQHYKEDKESSCYIPFKYQVERDDDKYKLAKEFVDDYIIIDCRHSDLEFIKNNIYKSKLNEWYDLSIINWNKVEKDCATTLVNEVCNYYNDNNNLFYPEMIQQLCDRFNLSSQTIISYLIRGDKSNLCVFKRLSRKEASNIAQMLKAKPVYIKYNNISIYFSSKRELNNWLCNNQISYSIVKINQIIDTDQEYHGLLIYSCTKQQFNNMYDNPNVQTFGEKFHEYYVQKELEQLNQIDLEFKVS